MYQMHICLPVVVVTHHAVLATVLEMQHLYVRPAPCCQQFATTEIASKVVRFCCRFYFWLLKIKITDPYI